ncbi:ABC transporter ATP-binding protein [Wolbachia endosymbiont of Ctenocephalides felis wCfeT]|uniref:ABC transporter ATP-binding protein n=1 Tax=Wolbachia endosymbiont of Ctenocephalides felis wCfeT TaxID=2732593 RepID=UPI001FEC89B8|nr:ABC transporter ATP-binding protein [Wolbachia endosymbiont of Ctenocephalides felis wCfeT]
MTAKQVIYFILKMLSSFKWQVIFISLVPLVWAIDQSFNPYMVKIILDCIAVSSDFEYLAIPVVSYIVILFLMACIHRLYDYLMDISLVPNLRRKINDSSFEVLLGQSNHYYQNNFAGSLANKVNNLVDNIPKVIQLILEIFLFQLLALGIAIYTLWTVNVSFAIAMLAWLGSFIILSLTFVKKLTRLSAIWSEYGSTIAGKIVDVFSNILSVRLFARNSTERASLRAVCKEDAAMEQRIHWIYFWIFCAYGFSYVIMQGCNLYFLIKGKQQGIITIGDFALVMGINSTIASFLWLLTRNFSQFVKIWGRIIKGLKIILVTPEVQDKPNATDLVIKEGKINFDKVHFHYKGTEPIFEDKSIIIKSGQKVGLIGYSGGGKSTFVNLILRLYDVQSGKILIDGQDISDVTQDSLRKNISMIPQDPSLFHRTLMENIRYGSADASDEGVIEAAKRAHAHEFIEKLPQGYESMVGERGVKLSGGQRQRIAIARAILKTPLF